MIIFCHKYMSLRDFDNFFALKNSTISTIDNLIFYNFNVCFPIDTSMKPFPRVMKDSDIGGLNSEMKNEIHKGSRVSKF